MNTGTKAPTRSATSPAPSEASTCPTSRRSGLGNVIPLEGCPPQPGAPAVAGRLLERSKGKDTTTGHWEHMGIVTPTAFPTYPHGFPDDVIDPFMNQTGRGVLGNKPASGTEIIQELGEEHQKTGKWIVYTSADSVFQIAAHEEHDPARGALRRLSRRARDPHRPPRGRAGDRSPVRGRARELRADAEPSRLLARARAVRTTCRSIRDAGNTVFGVGKISDIFAGLRHRRVVPDEVERRWDQPHDRAPRERSTRASSS